MSVYNSVFCLFFIKYLLLHSFEGVPQNQALKLESDTHWSRLWVGVVIYVCRYSTCQLVCPAVEAQSNSRWIFQRHRLLFDYSKILGCYSTTLLLYLRHPPSFGDKDLRELNSCFKSPFLPSVSKRWGRTSACMVVSWSCLFSLIHHWVVSYSSNFFLQRFTSSCSNSLM